MCKLNKNPSKYENIEIERKKPLERSIEKIENNDFNLIDTTSLEIDNSTIEFFNQRQNDTYRLRTSMLPSHFTLNILESKVVLLASNPSYVEKEVENFYCNPKIHQRINCGFNIFG
jgi:hypothetical protein